MAVPTTRAEFQDYCLRQLGAEILEINLTPNQISDCIDDAITYWHTFHIDSSEKRYVPYVVVEEDVQAGYLTIDMPILAVVSVINIGRWEMSTNGATLGNPIWHMKADLYSALGFTAGSGNGAIWTRHPHCNAGRLFDYLVNMEKLRNYEVLLNTAPRTFYYQHTNHLFVDDTVNLKAGDVFCLEAYVMVNPDQYRECWSDIWLKRYATARIGRLWGQVLSKYQSVQLPGGITLNGPELYQKYDQQIKELEEEIRSTFEYPPMFLMA